MRLAIMQPYFIPYLGYWQMMKAVDQYIVYDDVNYIKGGWINRNNVLMQGQARLYNLPVLGASPNKLINEVEVNCDPRQQTKTLRTLEMCYSHAPYYAQVYPLMQNVLMYQENNLAKYLMHSFEVIGEYLGITAQMKLSSELEKDCSLKAHEKVIDICRRTGATEYYNAIGGIPLYEPHRAEFEEHGIDLKYLKMKPVEYKQYKNEFVPNLSIVDVMMFNSQEECQKFLSEYELIRPPIDAGV